jgi:hypothetical protein
MALDRFSILCSAALQGCPARGRAEALRYAVVKNALGLGHDGSTATVYEISSRVGPYSPFSRITADMRLRMNGSKPQISLIAIVRAASKLEVGGVGGSAVGIRHDVVILEKPSF